VVVPGLAVVVVGWTEVETVGAVTEGMLIGSIVWPESSLPQPTTIRPAASRPSASRTILTSGR
jgi:hypothetical protein